MESTSKIKKFIDLNVLINELINELSKIKRLEERIKEREEYLEALRIAIEGLYTMVSVEK